MHAFSEYSRLAGLRALQTLRRQAKDRLPPAPTRRERSAVPPRASPKKPRGKTATARVVSKAMIVTSCQRQGRDQQTRLSPQMLTCCLSLSRPSQVPSLLQVPLSHALLVSLLQQQQTAAAAAPVSIATTTVACRRTSRASSRSLLLLFSLPCRLAAPPPPSVSYAAERLPSGLCRCCCECRLSRGSLQLSAAPLEPQRHHHYH